MTPEPIRTSARHWAFLLGITGLILAFDQASKAWVVQNFLLYESRAMIPFLAPVFNFTYTQNTGAAFGMFESASNIFLLIAIVATAVITYFYRNLKGDAWPLRFGMALQLGGALGNALDRVTRGFVVDFLHLFYDPLNWDWPIFNFADVSIVLGVLLVVGILWLEDEDEMEDESKTIQETTDPAKDNSPP